VLSDENVSRHDKFTALREIWHKKKLVEDQSRE
jgi:hypothetical protein